MALPLISEWIRLVLIDRLTPPAVPVLTEPLVLGTTPGIKDKNKLLPFKTARNIMGSFDVSTKEYQLGSKILSQDRQYPAPEKVYIWNINRPDYRLASLITGSVADNNALQWYADKSGDFGNRLWVALRNTATGNTALSHTVVAELRVGAGDAELKFTQKDKLSNIVRIELADPERPNRALKVEVWNEHGIIPDERVEYRTLQGFYDYHIKISLATNLMEELTTVADDIVQAFTNPENPAYNALAASLVDCAVVGSGTGVVAAAESTPIPVKVTIDLADDGALVTTKAWELAEYVNSDDTLASLLLVSNHNVSTGMGTVWEETGQALATEADPNPTGIADSDTGLRLADADNAELAIQFTAGSALRLAAVQAKLRRVGTIAAGKFVWFEVQTDAGGLPSGTAVATSAKRLCSSISTVYSMLEFKFPQHVALTQGSVYHVVLKGDYAPSASNYIAVATDDVSADGVGEILDETWDNAPTKNFCFRLFRVNEANPHLNISTTNTAPSSLELVRGLNAMRTYAEVHKMNVPYFMCCTSLDEVAGDRLELSNAQAAQKHGIYITTNTNDEAANVPALGDLMDAMKSDRTGFAAHSNPETQRLDAAIVGFFSAITAATVAGALGPSSRGCTLFWGKLNAVTPAKWTDYERALIFRNAPGQTAGITYQEDLGNMFVTGSWDTAGGYLDWRWMKDYIKMRLTLAYFKMFSDGPPTFDNPGIARIEGVTTLEMDMLTQQGLIGAWDNERTIGIYDVNCPRINKVRSDDFARRTYRFTVQAQPAWAIEQLDAIFEFSFLANVFAPA